MKRKKENHMEKEMVQRREQKTGQKCPYTIC